MDGSAGSPPTSPVIGPAGPQTTAALEAMLQAFRAQVHQEVTGRMDQAHAELASRLRSVDNGFQVATEQMRAMVAEAVRNGAQSSSQRPTYLDHNAARNVRPQNWDSAAPGERDVSVFGAEVRAYLVALHDDGEALWEATQEPEWEDPMITELE